MSLRCCFGRVSALRLGDMRRRAFLTLPQSIESEVNKSPSQSHAPSLTRTISARRAQGKKPLFVTNLTLK